MAQETGQPVRIREYVAYGFGDLASVLYLRFFSFYLLYYYVELKGLSPAAIGLMLLLTRIFDAVTDPGMGLISDRTRSRWGCYRPYILWGAIPYGIGGYLVFAAPDLSGTGLLIWAYATFSLVMLIYTVVNVPYSGLLGVISPKAGERETATAYRFVFAAMSDIVMALVAATIIRVVGQNDEAFGVTVAMAAVALIATTLLLMCFAGTRERISPPAVQSTPKTDIVTLIKVREWLIVLVCAITVMVGIASHATSAIFYIRYIINDDGQPIFLFIDRIGLFMGVGSISALGAIVGRLLFKRFDKGPLLVASLLAQCIFKACYLIIPADGYAAAVLLNCAYNLVFGISLVALFSMYTDIARHIHWKFHLQMTGLVISASLFSMKLGGAVGGAVPGFIMDMTGFVAGQPQTETAIWGIYASFSLIPAMVLLTGTFAARYYGITRSRLGEIEAELDARAESQTAH